MKAYQQTVVLAKTESREPASVRPPPGSAARSGAGGRDGNDGGGVDDAVRSRLQGFKSERASRMAKRENVVLTAHDSVCGQHNRRPGVRLC